LNAKSDQEPPQKKVPDVIAVLTAKTPLNRLFRSNRK
jgi:hypothetical protein